MHEVEKSTYIEYKRRLNIVLNYINEHIAEELNLDSLADVAMFSKFHFHRIFKVFVGETVADYIRRIRLERAAHFLLYDPLKSIADVAFDCGFSSQANFAKAFKKHFSRSPSEMRSDAKNSKIGKTDSNDGKRLKHELIDITDVQDTVKPLYQLFGERQMKVEVKDIPSYTLAYGRHIGPYGSPEVSELFEKLGKWGGPRRLIGPSTLFLGISYDNPDITPPEKCRYDACMTIPSDTAVEGELSKGTLEGGTYAVYHCEIENMNFKDPWNMLYEEWLPQSGYQPDDKPCFEIYYNDPNTHPEKKFIVDLCLPVKPL